MKKDHFTKILMIVIAALLFLNFVQGFVPTKSAVAAAENNDIGRYQITSWAARADQFTHHSGYFIIDTVTGKVVDKQAMIHSTREIGKMYYKEDKPH